MKFKKPKELVAERLKEAGFRKPKLLFHPKRGDVFNRTAYGLVRGKLGVVTEREVGEEILQGYRLESCCDVELLARVGSEKPDSAIVRGGKGVVDFSGIELNYPTVAVDLSLYRELIPKERKSLLNQIEITYGVVKDYFTPENFVLTSVGSKEKESLRQFFKPSVPFPLFNRLTVPFPLFNRLTVPFPLFNRLKEENIIVLDPHGDKDFTHEEVTPKSVIVLGGIVDRGERMIGSTGRLYPNAKHRRISFNGNVELVPDRLNGIVEILCYYLTEKVSLSEAVRRNTTKTAKLRWLRKQLENSVVRFSVQGKTLRGVSENFYKRWKDEFQLTEFHFNKAAKHVGGFFVFRNSIFDRIKGKENRRGKEIFNLKELKDEDIVKVYTSNHWKYTSFKG